MAKPKSATIEYRGPLGIVVKLTPEEFYELTDPGRLEPPKVKRKRATFLPGVNPKWEAEQALQAARRARGADPNGYHEVEM